MSNFILYYFFIIYNLKLARDMSFHLVPHLPRLVALSPREGEYSHAVGAFTISAVKANGSRPTRRTALKPADDKARLMMSFKAECRGKRQALKRQERGCRPYLSTMAPQRHLCGAQTVRSRR